MLLDRLVNSRTTQALELTTRFAEQRHHVLAENLANIDTPDFQSRRLDPEPFQTSLHKALQQAAKTHQSRLELRGNAQFATRRDGSVEVRPAREPAPNVLFQDGTNARLEQLLGDVAQNSLSYELGTTLLRGQFESVLRAIRGRVT